MAERDRDESGRPRNSRPRDALGRVLPPGSEGVARVPDDLYRAIRPMLATSGGRLICLSTPYGKRGFFYDAWAKGGDDWLRIEIPATQVSRIKPAFLEKATGPGCK